MISALESIRMFDLSFPLAYNVASFACPLYIPRMTSLTVSTRKTEMNIGKLVRLNRIFSHPSGRLCSIAVDHFIGYAAGLPNGLRQIQATLAAIVAAEPDAITMHKGIVTSAWAPFAGKVPLIVQSIIGRPDETAYEQLVTPEEAVRLGADAIAVAAYVRGKTEARYLRVVSDCVIAFKAVIHDEKAPQEALRVAGL
jgi:DhnA family fructose-bisphosphate aldolase class Ia